MFANREPGTYRNSLAKQAIEESEAAGLSVDAISTGGKAEAKKPM
jgi:hypothetical protein